jgi:hypothetical protein
MPSAPPGFTCLNTCAGYSDYDYAENGQLGMASNSQCDDGGPGSAHSVCALGTDCADCGARYLSPPPPPPPPPSPYPPTGAPPPYYRDRIRRLLGLLV